MYQSSNNPVCGQILVQMSISSFHKVQICQRGPGDVIQNYLSEYYLALQKHQYLDLANSVGARGRNQNTSEPNFEKLSVSRPAVILPTARLDPRFGNKFEYTNILSSKMSIASCTVQKQFCAMTRLRLSKSSTTPLRKDEQIQSQFQANLEIYQTILPT